MLWGNQEKLGRGPTIEVAALDDVEVGLVGQWMRDGGPLKYRVDGGVWDGFDEEAPAFWSVRTLRRRGGFSIMKARSVREALVS